MFPRWIAGLVVGVIALFGLVGFSGGAGGTGPEYDAEGYLLLPNDFESWVFVGSSLGLTYAEEPPSHEMFHNVYIEPEAYRHFRKTDEFPDKTMLAMTLYGVEEKKDFGSGKFSGELHGFEMAVKDEERFDEGWAYYGFGGMGGMGQVSPRALAQPRSNCYDCHQSHAAQDNVFLQYYPVLRRLTER